MTTLNNLQTSKLRTVLRQACLDRLSMTALNNLQTSKLQTVLRPAQHDST